MTEQSTGVGAGELRGAEPPENRKVRPTLAFLAAFPAFGLGYVYVGKIRLAIGMLATIYGVVAVFAWTRLIIHSASMFWLLAAIVVLILAIALVHPIVIAIRNRNRPRNGYNRWWIYILWIVAINGLAFAVTRNRAGLFGFATFHTPAGSMSPTILRDDFFLADTWRYRNRGPSNGEIVVFERPGEPGLNYVKRVAGVPGDRVEARDAVFYRNGVAVTEPYLHAHSSYVVYGRDFGPTVVGAGEVFLLGDYRDNSMDSRVFGPIPIDHLRGRAEYVWLSFAVGVDRGSRVGILLRP